MSALLPIAPDLWATAIPHRFIGLHIGTRMTVIRLSSGDVVLHSPVPIDNALREAINAIGPVRHITCPNLLHHTYPSDAVATLPDARLHRSAKLLRKRKDLKFDAVLVDKPHPNWKPELLQQNVEGGLLNETLFFHLASSIAAPS